MIVKKPRGAKPSSGEISTREASLVTTIFKIYWYIVLNGKD